MGAGKMDMHSREQYLEALREEYLRASKKQKTRLLNEARKRTKLNRKVLIRKLTRVPAAAESPSGGRAQRPTAWSEGPLIRFGSCLIFRAGSAWRRSCGSRRSGYGNRAVEVQPGSGSAFEEISPKTIDRLLAREREVRCLKQHRRPPVHPLLYQRVPVKAPANGTGRRLGICSWTMCCIADAPRRANMCSRFRPPTLPGDGGRERRNWGGRRRPHRRAWSDPAAGAIPGAGGASGQ